MNYYKAISIIGIVLIAVIIASCATIITGTTDTVNIKSEPEGAIVVFESTDGIYKEQKKTPAIFTIPSDKTYTLSIKINGYKTKNIVLERKISGWVLGNILVGGIIGIAVDFISGGAYIHEKAVNVKLEKKLPDKITLKILLINHKEKLVTIPVVWEKDI